MATLTVQQPLTPKEQKTRHAQAQIHALARALILNRRLTLALFVAAFAFGLCARVTWQAKQTILYQREHPVVLRVDKLGQGEIVGPRDAGWEPTEPELVKALGDFVICYYSRQRAIFFDPYFGHGAGMRKLEAGLARSMQEQDRMQNWIPDFINAKTSQYIETTDENDVVIDSVVPHGLTHPPGQMPHGTATVTYHETFFGSDRHVTGRKDFTEDLYFTFAPRIVPSMYMTNPTGLVITFFRHTEILSRS